MNEHFQSVSVIGLGYIGLPTASLLATKGFQVHGCDINAHVVDTINRGEIHITEQDLDVLVRSAVNSGQLKAYTEPQAADVFIIAVPTPFQAGFKPDLSYVESSIKAVAPVLKPGNLLILESTSPIGTTEQIAQWLSELRPDLNMPSPQSAADESDIYIGHCPERVLPGQIIRELVDNDRIVGGINEASVVKASEFYSLFVNGELLTTDARTAEMAKLTENAYRDVNIAFANELSAICEHIDINVWDLIRLANHHPRVNILQPGPGVGGHCIAVDPWFIIDAAPEQTQLIHQARQVNETKPKHVIAKVSAQADRYKAPVIACLGLAYKPNIDDLRESPSLYITEELAKLTLERLLVVEPHIEVLPESLQAHSPTVELVSVEQALASADIVVVLVKHNQFLEIDRQRLSEKVIFDTCGLLQ